MTKQEAEKCLAAMEAKIKDDEAKSYAPNSNVIIAAVALQTALKNGVYEDPEQEKQVREKAGEVLRKHKAAQKETQAKKRGRPKGSKNKVKK